MHKRGFTLVEIIVALAIFGVVSIMALSSLFNISGGFKKAQVSRQALDNVDLVLDDIIREARLAKNFHCDATTGSLEQPRDCLAGADSLALTRLDTNDVVVYRALTLGNGKKNITKHIVSKGVPSPQQILTVDGIDIPLLKFYVRGSGEKDGEHARVLVTMRANFQEGNASTTMNFQTTIAQRYPDN
jgi:prepilin-type N-terminal cleavage/methylation domain-containing protein